MYYSKSGIAYAIGGFIGTAFAMPFALIAKLCLKLAKVTQKKTREVF